MHEQKNLEHKKPSPVWQDRWNVKLINTAFQDKSRLILKII